MKIRHYLLQKPSILIWVSVLSGFFVTSEEIMDCIELSRIRGIDPEIDSILLLIFQCLFFILFTRILLQINVCWQPEKKGHLKQFAYSSLVSVLFSLIVWLGVSPVIRAKRTERKPPFPWEEAFLLVPRARGGMVQQPFHAIRWNIHVQPDLYPRRT